MVWASRRVPLTVTCFSAFMAHLLRRNAASEGVQARFQAREYRLLRKRDGPEAPPNDFAWRHRAECAPRRALCPGGSEHRPPGPTQRPAIAASIALGKRFSKSKTATHS